MKCKICGKTLKKQGRTMCYGCRCATYFAKNGENTAQTRLTKAISHLQKAKAGTFGKIFGI